MDTNGIEVKKAKRFKLLKAIYDEAGGNLQKALDREPFVKKVDLPPREIEEILGFLANENLIKVMRYFIGITREGKGEVERAVESPDEPTNYFQPVNMMNAQATPASPQTPSPAVENSPPSSPETPGLVESPKQAAGMDEEFMTVTVAEIYLREGQVNKAIRILEKITREDPQNTEAKHKLAKAQQEKGRLTLIEESKYYHIICSAGLQAEEGKDQKVYNACLGMDIVGFTKETNYQLQQRWIRQFYSILQRLFDELMTQKNKYGRTEYLLIMVGDGAYICFLNPESIYVHFKYLERFKQELDKINSEENANATGGRGWRVRSALTFGQDYLTRHDFGVKKFINVYGPAITLSARLLAIQDDLQLSGGEMMTDSDIRVDGAVHSSIEGDEYFKAKYKQTRGTSVVKGKDFDFVAYRQNK